MFLPAETVAKIAAQHGLSIQDAAALRSLADTESEAHAIAAKFAGSDTDSEMRAVAKTVFDRAKRTAPKRWTGDINSPNPPAA